MTKGEEKMLETEVVIFPMEFGENDKEDILSQQTEILKTVEEKSIKIDIKTRFARLKKSLRKRSASIL